MGGGLDFLSKALPTLLENQFVNHNGETFKVIQGSGMGMPHSPNACNLAFYKLVESTVVGDQRLRSTLGLSTYARYHDDVFFIAGSPSQADLAIDTLKKQAEGMYSISVEAVSTKEAQMLDILVFKEGSRLLFRPYIKPTAVHVPLHESSCHPASVHRSWPLSEIRRLKKRSVRRCDFVLAARKKVEKFQWHFMSPKVLRQVLAAVENPSLPPPRLAETKRTARLIVDFNPSFVPFSAIVKRCADRWSEVLSHLGLGIDIQVAFRSCNKPLLLQLRSLRVR